MWPRSHEHGMAKMDLRAKLEKASSMWPCSRERGIVALEAELSKECFNVAAFHVSAESNESQTQGRDETMFQ